MVNLCESLINIVIRGKLKMLTSLGQKARGTVRRVLVSFVADTKATGGKARPNPLSVLMPKRGKPVIFPFG